MTAEMVQPQMQMSPNRAQVQMQPVLGPDGRPQVGPNGQPMMRPMFPMMTQMIGPDGRPVLGPNGQPFMMPVQQFGSFGQPQFQPQGQPQFRPQYQPQPLARSQIQTEQARFNKNQVVEETGSTYQASQECWGSMTGWCATWLCCCCQEPPYKQVPQGYTGIIQRFGKFYKLVPPGLHYLNPELDQLVLVDKRETVLNLPKQVVQTKDNVTITIDSVLYYEIVDSYKSKFGVSNLSASLADIIQTVLRNAIGKLTLQEVLEQKDHLAEIMLEHITGPVFKWGAKVTRALIQEIFFGRDQQSTLSQGALARKIAEARVIQSQADVESARLMKEASDILSTDAAMQIRYLESLESIARTANPKYVFFPADYREMGSLNEHL